MFRRWHKPEFFDEMQDSVQKNDTSAVADLLARGADINMTDKTQGTPLIWAACRTLPEMVAFLVENSANVTHKEKQGYDAIALAYWHGEYRMGAYTDEALRCVELLKQAGGE